MDGHYHRHGDGYAKVYQAHKNYLWLGFANGSLQNSALGDPTGAWTPLHWRQ